MGVLLYPVLYNLIYMRGMVDDMPVAAVDRSDGAYSRRYLQKVDATRECEILTACTSLEEARVLMQQQKVHGIIYIPADFDERIVRGEQGHISTYADMSSFLYYKCLTMGTSLTMLDEMHEIQIERYAAGGLDGQSISQLVQPVLADEEIPYNRPFSYTIFFISAALLLVIQQTMFYGGALLAGTLREQNRSFVSLPGHQQGLGVGRVVLGRGAAYLSVYLVTGTLIALFIPWLFHLPQRAFWGDVLLLLVFYIIDCIFFTFTWSSLIWRRETVFALFLSVSPICMFLTGFSWPQSAIPAFWQRVACLFPSTFGCRAFINLNTAGCTLADVAPELRAIALQTVVYYFLACASAYAENTIVEHKRRLAKVCARVDARLGLPSEEESRRIITGEIRGDEGVQ